MDIESIAKVLADDPSITEQRILVAEASFYLKGIAQEITVRIYYTPFLPVGDRYEFELSHYIHTPTQAGPYTPSAPYTSDAASAMRRAVSALTDYYNEAVKAGHSPTEEWLVEG